MLPKKAEKKKIKLAGIFSEELLGTLDLSNPERRRLRGDLIALPSFLSGTSARKVVMAQRCICQLERKHCSTKGTIKPWNRLPGEVVKGCQCFNGI